MVRVESGAAGARGWVLVRHDEVGLLERLRPLVRGSRRLVLVRLPARAAPPRDARVGIVSFDGGGLWLRALTAAEAGALLGWLASAPADLLDPPAALRHRVDVPALQRRP